MDPLMQPSPSLEERVLRVGRSPASIVGGSPPPVRKRGVQPTPPAARPGQPMYQAARRAMATGEDVERAASASQHPARIRPKSPFANLVMGAGESTDTAARRGRLSGDLFLGAGENPDVVGRRPRGKPYGVSKFSSSISVGDGLAGRVNRPFGAFSEGLDGLPSMGGFGADDLKGIAGGADEAAGLAGVASKAGRFGKALVRGGGALGLVGLLATAGGDSLVEGLGNLADPSRRATRAANEREQREQIRAAEQLMMMSQQRTQRLTEEAMILMATKAPHLFNESAAGRRLPRGATVVGGQPQMDILGQIAGRLASGEYMKADDPAVQMLAQAQMRGM